MAARDGGLRGEFGQPLVVAAARIGATELYTEDLTDGQEILGVRIANPFAGNKSS